MQGERKKPWPTKAEAAAQVVLMLPYYKGGATVDELVAGRDGNGECSTHLSHSECQRAIGWLYGRGRLRVVALKEGVEVWAVATMNSKKQEN